MTSTSVVMPMNKVRETVSVVAVSEGQNQIPAGSATPAGSTGPAHPAPGRQFGLPTATALVIGSVIGTGVFALPSALAPYGPISLVAFALITAGAIALALTFGALSKRVPGSGGPYVYAREAFGDFPTEAEPLCRTTWSTP